jgi:hypothetical protein
MNQRTGFAILLFAVVLLIVASATHLRNASAAGECPAGQAKDWAGVCYPLKECKGSISAQPGTCTQSERYAGCPSGQIKDWAGICFKESEAKACPTCVPGSAAAAEKPSTSTQGESTAEKTVPIKSTKKPHCTLGTKVTRFPSGVWICLNPHGHL